MINNINWHDSYLDRINIEFDKCLIELTDSGSKYRVIICNKFSSISYIGQCDENVIESMKISDYSELITKTTAITQEKGLGNTIPNFKQLEIDLIDGTAIQIVAQDFTIT